jgi:CelD/BcsL family acetyltransferase involved in cellulose biosynthesis
LIILCKPAVRHVDKHGTGRPDGSAGAASSPLADIILNDPPHDLGASGLSVRALDDSAAIAAAGAWLARHGHGSPFHRPDWMAAWMDTAGRAAGAEPLVLAGMTPAGAPAFLWPLSVTRLGPVRIARFMGGSHVNHNFPLWDAQTARAMTPATMAALLREIAGLDTGVDLLALTNQPLAYDGLANPLRLLPHSPAPDVAYAGDLMADPVALMATCMSSATRKKFAKKQRKLAERGEVRFLRAATPDDVAFILDAFHRQKATRFAELGIANVFLEPGVPAFLERAALSGLDAGGPAVELHALVVGGDVAATYGAAVSAKRFSCMFNSIDRARYGRESAGQLLLIHLAEEACRRGLTRFDLGVGEGGYKDLFCEEAEPLFDQVLALSAKGRLAGLAIATAQRTKRMIKTTPLLWSLVTRLRRLRNGAPVAVPSAPDPD